MILRCCGICHRNALPIVEKGLEQFAKQTDIRVDGEGYSDPSDLYRCLTTLPGQIVFVAHPGTMGMEVAKRSRELLPDIPLIMRCCRTALSPVQCVQTNN